MKDPTLHDAQKFNLPIIDTNTPVSVHKPAFSIDTQVWMTDTITNHHNYHFFNLGTNALTIIEEMKNGDYKEIKAEDIPKEYLYPIFWKMAAKFQHLQNQLKLPTVKEIAKATNINFNTKEKTFLKDKVKRTVYWIEDILDILATNPDPKLAAESTIAVSQLENHIDNGNFTIFMNLE